MHPLAEKERERWKGIASIAREITFGAVLLLVTLYALGWRP